MSDFSHWNVMAVVLLYAVWIAAEYALLILLVDDSRASATFKKQPANLTRL